MTETTSRVRGLRRTLVRGVISGGTATAAMTLSYMTERRFRRAAIGLAPLDYDDGLVPGQIVLHILKLPDLGASEETTAGLLLRWAYGSVFGTAHVLLRKRVPEPAATIIFGSALLGMTMTMFPILGHTPPPWRWPAALMATSLATHAVYVVAGAVTDDRISRRWP